MIAGRARELTLLMEKTFQVEQALAESESFQATTEAVERLGEQLQRLGETYWRVADLLGPNPRVDVRRTFESAGEQLHQIRLQLRTSPRQSSEIGRLSKQVSSAFDRLEAAWRKWSSEQVQPHRDALGLVNFLPEIEAQRSTIDAILEQLAALSQTLPDDDETLIKFRRTLETLSNILKDVEGLSSSIRDFLRKVVSNQATFEDVDSEILDWIQERGRARAFRIQFRAMRG